MQHIHITKYQGRPLRILQVHTLYPTYVPYYYSLFPHVASQSFSTQVEKLYEHGLQDMYMVAPALTKIGCEAQLIYSNAPAAQRAWCVENGFPVDVFSNPRWEQKILAAQIEAFKPDVLFFTDNHSFDGAFLETLSFQPRLIVAWRHAPIQLNTNWKGFDILLSASRRVRNLAIELGANEAFHYIFGLPKPAIFPIDESLKQRDIFFCGTYQTPFAPHCHAERRELLNIAAEISNKQNFTFDMFLTDKSEILPQQIKSLVNPPLYGKHMYKEIMRSRIGIDALGAIVGTIQGTPILRLTAGDGSNMRLFEHANYGALVFTENRGRLCNFFTPQKEIVTYHSREDFKEKLSYYLCHKNEAKEIATAGYNRIRKQFDQSKTLVQLLEIFHKGLKKKNYPKKQKETVQIPPVQVLQKMITALSKCPYSSDSIGWELEENLFKIACALAVKGDYVNAYELDTLINQTAFATEDMGYLAESLKHPI